MKEEEKEKETDEKRERREKAITKNLELTKSDFKFFQFLMKSKTRYKQTVLQLKLALLATWYNIVTSLTEF